MILQRQLPIMLFFALLFTACNNSNNQEPELISNDFRMRATMTGSCGGGIFRGASGAGSFLDPDGDGDIVEAGTGFSDCSIDVEEMNEFEDLTNSNGCTSCQQAWQKMPNFGEVNSDLFSQSGCSQTDLIGDSLAGNDYLYSTIIDPDSVCSSGDEMIIFRVRTAATSTGSFSFSLLIDTDLALGDEDPDGVICASKISNIGFEYEIVANPGNGKNITVYDVNGVVGTSNSTIATYDNTVYYNQADACRSECGCSTGAVYHTFGFLLSDIGKSCADTDMRVLMSTSTSGNGTVISNTSISDIGGVGEEPDCSQTQIDNCGCCEECDDINSPYYCGSLESCLQNCQLACATLSENVILPVELTSFNVTKDANSVELDWTTATELNSDYFDIERSDNGIDFESIGTLVAAGNSEQTLNYNFIDDSPTNGFNYYRLALYDLDGNIAHTETKVVQFQKNASINIFPTQVTDRINVEINAEEDLEFRRMILTTSGQVLETDITNISSGISNQQVDVSHLQSGAYILIVYLNGQAIQHKFIKV
jgi:hypothetical protein